jgi:Flp pilus assembly protein TadG
MMKQASRRRGQALTETVMVLPLLVFLLLGATDLGRAYYMKLEMSGASRAGVRMAVIGLGTDIGNAVRAEPNSAIPNTTATWGAYGPGGLNDCNPSASTHACGYTGIGVGCPAAAFVGAQVACFAVRTCATWTNGVCGGVSAWGTRPLAGVDQAVEVLVVYKFSPATPLITNFTSNGSFYLPGDTTGLQLY